MNKVNAEMQEHGDMVMLPVSLVAWAHSKSELESSHQDWIRGWGNGYIPCLRSVL